MKKKDELENEIDKTINESKRLRIMLDSNKNGLIDEIKNGLGESIKTVGNKIEFIEKPKPSFLDRVNNSLRNFFKKF